MKRIAVGECVFLAVMLAVYAVIGRFSLAVVLGGIVILKHKDNIRRLYRGEEKTIW